MGSGRQDVEPAVGVEGRPAYGPLGARQRYTALQDVIPLHTALYGFIDVNRCGASLLFNPPAEHALKEIPV